VFSADVHVNSLGIRRSRSLFNLTPSFTPHKLIIISWFPIYIFSCFNTLDTICSHDDNDDEDEPKASPGFNTSVFFFWFLLCTEGETLLTVQFGCVCVCVCVFGVKPVITGVSPFPAQPEDAAATHTHAVYTYFRQTQPDDLSLQNLDFRFFFSRKDLRTWNTHNNTISKTETTQLHNTRKKNHKDSDNTTNTLTSKHFSGRNRPLQPWVFHYSLF